MQQQKCYIPGCQNQSLTHGLCLEHTRIPDNQLHPTSGIRKDVTVTMAGLFFNSLSVTQSVEEFLEQVLPVVRVPFIPDEKTFRFQNYQGHRDDDKFEITPTETLRLRDELVEGIREPNVVDRPIVFLVVTNIPHTSLYILYGGQFYSVGFGVHRLDDGSRCGALYSIDITLTQFSEARIVWIGILTGDIIGRLQDEFNMVQRIVGFMDDGPPIVDRAMYFHTTKVFAGRIADHVSDLNQCNCTKWAMFILFGVDDIPITSRELVDRRNPGLDERQLMLWLDAYRMGDPKNFISVLNQINDPSFIRAMGGRRRRMTNNRNKMKRKTRKMRRSRKN
jgi:hypothetical protein